MRKTLKQLCLVVLFLGLVSAPAFGHIFSNTFAELHMDFGKSAEHYGDVHSAGIWTLTIEHYSSFAYGDNFFFIDFCSSRNFEFGTNEGSLYLEYAPRFSINKIFGMQKWDSFISEAYLTPQLNYGYSAARFGPTGPDRASFGIGPVFLFGPSFDLNIPGIQVLQVQFLYRYEFRDNDAPEPVYGTRQYDDSGFQFTLVWGAKLANLFETAPAAEGDKNVPPSKAGELWTRGFFDVWDRGALDNDHATLLTEPQLYLYVTNDLAIGTEIEFSINFSGARDNERHFEVDPTLFVRWDF